MLIIVLFAIACKNETKTVVSVTNIGHWKYKGIDGRWRNYYVPGNLLTQLKNDTIIDDFYIGKKIKTVKWVQDTGWILRGNFQINKEIQDYRYEIDFVGFVGVADVYFNNHFLFRADDFFKNYHYDISDLVKKGRNTLLFKMRPIDKIKKEYATKYKNLLPKGGVELLRLPEFYTDTVNFLGVMPSGLSKNVYIKRWKNAVIRENHFIVKDLKIDDYAELEAVFEIEARKEGTYNFMISHKSKVYVEDKIKLHKGLNIKKYVFKIKKPKLWWTYDMGKPYLYKFKAILSKDASKIQIVEKNIGIRKIQIDTTNHDFTLYLNGKPLILRIMNYVSGDYFYEKMSAYVYQKYVKDMVFANINMVHITENGIYENDKFYEECDKQGILVWQDFMLPYKVLPNDRKILQNIQDETEFQIKRLRSHPSLAFWSGQNFYTEYIEKNNFNYKDRDKVKEANSFVFSDLLPKLVSTLDSGRYYFEKMDFYSIVNVTDYLPEYPLYSTYKTFVPVSCRKKYSKTVRIYSRPKNSDSIIDLSIKKNYAYNAINIQSFIYLNHLIKKDYFYEKLLNLRFDTRFNGFIVGMYKDPCPMISRSAVDYNGKWKGKMYAIRKAFKPFLLRLQEKDNWVHLEINNKTGKDIKADFYFKLCDLDGKVYWRRNYMNQTIKSTYPKEYFSFNLSRELSLTGKNNAVFKVEVYYNRELYASEDFIFVKPVQLNLKSVEIRSKIFNMDGGYAVELTDDKFAYGIEVYTDRQVLFNDNYFMLIPGESKKVILYTDDVLGNRGKFVKTISLVDKNKPILYD